MAVVPPVVYSTNTSSAAADFLRIDSELALTFSGIALAASELAMKTRTTIFARKAYDTIARLQGRVELTGTERDRLEVNLAKLRADLQGLGQTL
ncbi:MAG TPA: hypothetical protein VGG04_13185 [Candidatus Sulfotelmatobacter sp.]|jgi:hypothetical protein